MPSISIRRLEMPESPIRKLALLAVAAKAQVPRSITSISVSPTCPSLSTDLDVPSQKKVEKILHW